MYANGFFEQKRRSPVSLAAVIGLHAAAFGAVILYGTTTFVAQKSGNTVIFDVPIEPPPPPDPPPPQRQQDQVPQQPSRPTTVPTDIPIPGPVAGPVTPPRPYEPPAPPGPRIELAAVATPRIPDPVRRAAEVDPRFRAALQPPYPPDRERAEENGQVRVRITIGTDGHVTAIEQISSTHEAFWRVTQRQALSRWRFRPATVDGRPIVSTMTMTVTFRIPDA